MGLKDKDLKTSLPARFRAGVLEAGCDEAGRGCLAGPVVAAAVILPEKYSNPLINDSKKLKAWQRASLVRDIKEAALTWAIGICDEQEILSLNIANASYRAMHKALDKLTLVPQCIIVDGHRFTKYKAIEHICVKQGDGKFLHIAAASILAKHTRDEIMKELDAQFPGYGWKDNFGYCTPKHIAALEKIGPCARHRIGFEPIKSMIATNLFDK